MAKKTDSAAPATIGKLVETFTEHRETYHRAGYNETQLRQDFLDPFFEALGWDVNNRQGFAEAYRDVILEQALKVEKSVRAPDYCFRVGGTPKFFVEAKKPAVDVKMDVSPAFQLRRYAWTAKLPLSILTDFEEFAVYDCRVKPDKDDEASTARVLFLTYREYEERWGEIAGIFSRDAILRGSFDKFAESNKKKRGTAEVDAAFLAEIESWREALAKNLSARNEALSDRELNTAVQLVIDRIIFLRMCEGRGIEDYGRLQALLNGERVYPRLVEMFHRADEKYNSGLFHFQKEKGREDPDTLTTSLAIDDKVLKDIVRRLYYPESPYEFAALPADILGQVYEQFLGKVIRLTAGHRAKIEEKPEVRKAGGVYYTPTYIVDYIVENTVGKLLEGKTAQEVGGLTATFKPAKSKTGRGGNARPLSVLDPACGSGSFLIVAYQYLLDWYLKQYTEVDKPESHSRGANPRIYQSTTGDWRLTIAERKRILLAHIYGVDIDYQACEVTKLSLLLKVLEGATDTTIQRELFAKQRALPDLAYNIKCGNSLIESDFYDGQQRGIFDDEVELRINAFDWKGKHGFPHVFSGARPGFDAVIGNPPYDVLEKDRGAASWPHSSLQTYVRKHQDYSNALGGKTNLFRFFLVRAIQLTRPDGRFGMIIPLALLADISCKNTRMFLLLSTRASRADCFPQKDNPRRRVFVKAKLSTTVVTAHVTHGVPKEGNPGIHVVTYPWNSFDDVPRQCLVRRSDMELLDPKYLPIPLTDEDSLSVCRQIHSRDDVIHSGESEDFCVTRGEINQTIYRKYITSDSAFARLLKGVEVGRYNLHHKLSQGNREWFDELKYLRSNSPKKIKDYRRIATQRITGVDERLRIVATLIDPPTYFADSTNSIYATVETSYSLNYLLGLLNSRMFQWRFRITSTNNNVGTNELDAMPLRRIDFTRKDDKKRHDQMVDLVQRMMDLHVRLAKAKTDHERTVLERRIDATDREIDRLVYELYGLTEDEIALVEGATK